MLTLMTAKRRSPQFAILLRFLLLWADMVSSCIESSSRRFHFRSAFQWRPEIANRKATGPASVPPTACVRMGPGRASAGCGRPIPTVGRGDMGGRWDLQRGLVPEIAADERDPETTSNCAYAIRRQAPDRARCRSVRRDRTRRISHYVPFDLFSPRTGEPDGQLPRCVATGQSPWRHR